MLAASRREFRGGDGGVGTLHLILVSRRYAHPVMARQYQLKEPEYVRQAMAALIAMKLEVEETNLVLYRPLPAELQPTFRRALERIEAGTPLAQIPELTKVRAHLDSEEHTRRDFGRFKRDYRALSLQLAEATAPPTPEQAQALFSLIAQHPAASPTSTTARQLAHDFARYPMFTASEYLDARYLAELQDSGWTCPFWLGRLYDSLRIRHLDPSESEDTPAAQPQAVLSSRPFRMPWEEPVPPPEVSFDRPPRLLFRDRAFLFTGKFEFGTRRKCREAVVACGACWEDNMTRAVDCLVVAGSGAAVTQFSGKVLGWADLRSKGWPCLLVSEEQWSEALKSK